MLVLVSGSVPPPILPVEPLESSLRQRLLGFRAQKADRMCMPPEFVLGDRLLEELVEQKGSPQVLARVDSRWRNLVKLPGSRREAQV